MSIWPQSEPPTLKSWVLCWAVAGFVCGFFGPIVLNPEANQGPLLGLLITGPGGALAGLCVGLIMKWWSLPAVQQWRALMATTIIGSVSILIFVLPAAELRGYVIQASIVECQPPLNFLPAAIEEWQQRIERVDWAEPRTDWQQDMRNKADNANGVVLRLMVQRRAAIYRHRKPWNNGVITSSGWEVVDSEKNYCSELSGADCRNYPEGRTVRYFPGSIYSRQWPADLLANFLGLQTLSEVPVEFHQHIN